MREIDVEGVRGEGVRNRSLWRRVGMYGEEDCMEDMCRGVVGWGDLSVRG